MSSPDELDEAARLVSKAAVVYSTAGTPSSTVAETVMFPAEGEAVDAELVDEAEAKTEPGLRVYQLEARFAHHVQASELHITVTRDLRRTVTQVALLAGLALVGASAALGLGGALGLVLYLGLR